MFWKIARESKILPNTWSEGKRRKLISLDWNLESGSMGMFLLLISCWYIWTKGQNGGGGGVGMHKGQDIV